MTAESEGRAAAEQFRADQRLGTQPLGDLVALIEQATGIDVAVLDAGPDEHGLTMRDPDQEAIVIAVARTRHFVRQRSSLAHELAHVLFKDWSVALDHTLSDRSHKEKRADAFARHLLIPYDGLTDFLDSPQKVGEATLSAVVQHFLVSPAVAAIALCQAKYITGAMKRKWMVVTTGNIAVRHGWVDQYHALQASSDQRRAPQRLLARALEGYRENVVSVETIARLRGLDAGIVEVELREAGVVPTEQPIIWAKAADLPDICVDLSDLDDETQDDADG